MGFYYIIVLKLFVLMWNHLKLTKHVCNRLTMFFLSQCSVTCGEGTETRLVACITLEHLEGQAMSPTQCDMAVKPSMERLCNLHTCPRIDRIVSISSNDVTGTAHWRVGHFGRVRIVFYF